MGRKHAPKGQVVLKKDEKLKAVAAALPAGTSPEDFAAKFREIYSGDWDRIVARYRAHERLTPRGKTHPMPKPETYLLNMVKNYLKA